MTCRTSRPNGSMPVLASHRPMTSPSWTSQAARYCNAPPRSYSASTAAAPTGGRPERRVTADAGLDAGLLVRADDAVERIDAFPLPVTFVQIQDDGGLLEEVAGAGEDPVFVLPRLDGVLVEDSPDRAPADGFVEFVSRAVGEIGRGLAAQRVSGASDHITGDRGDNGPVEGGKDRLAAPARNRPRE